LSTKFSSHSDGYEIVGASLELASTFFRGELMWLHRLSDIDEINRTATCLACGPVKIRKKSQGTGKSSWWRCQKQANVVQKKYNLRHPRRESRNGKNVKPTGWTQEKYKEAFEKQKGLCAICRKSSIKKLAGDHNHSTNETRGLLCHTCNVGLGMFYDDICLLASAIEYLKTY